MTSGLEQTVGKAEYSRWTNIVGTLVGVTMGTALISPRTIPYMMSVLVLAALAAVWSERRFESAKPNFEAVEWTALALILYCVLSMAWEEKPSAAVLPVVSALGCFIGAILMARVFSLTPPIFGPSRLARGFMVGLLFGVVYLLIEIFSKQSLKIALYNGLHIPKPWLKTPAFFTWKGDKLIAISPSDIARNIAPLSVSIWAAILVVTKMWSRTAARILFAIVFILTMFSEHETSKVALVWSGLVYLVAIWDGKWGHRLLCGAWIASCLAVIPVTLTLHRLDLHNSPMLQQSFRHRIIIWNHTSQETLKAPILGIGAGMMYWLDPNGVRSEEGDEFTSRAPHAHNVYLQTWFELGAIGAALLTLFGLAILERIRTYSDRVRPYAQATFASAMAIAAASYGTWQPWFLAMFEMCVVLFVIAAQYASSSEPRPIEPQVAAVTA